MKTIKLIEYGESLAMRPFEYFRAEKYIIMRVFQNTLKIFFVFIFGYIISFKFGFEGVVKRMSTLTKVSSHSKEYFKRELMPYFQ